jgi:hypothetical protein
MSKLILPPLDTPIKVLADGSRCEAGDTRTDHVAVLIPSANLLIHPVSLGDADGDALPSWQASVDRCSTLRLFDADDWQLAPTEVWERYIIDRSRAKPAVDSNLYPGIEPDWHWTSSDCAWQKKDGAGLSASAWYVSAVLGGVYGDHRGYNGFALAVRRAGQ